MFLTHALRAISRGISVVTDPFFKYVSLLLTGSGTNGAQNNTFVDSSTNNFTITRNGNTTQGTFSPYGSNWSNYFNGTSNYLTTPLSSVYAFGTGDFTVEFWINSKDTAGGCVVPANTFGTGYWALMFTSTTLYWQSSYGVTNLWNYSASTILNGSWNHVAISRASGSSKLFINGVLAATNADSTNYTYASSGLQIMSDTLQGSNGSNVGYLSGYISNLRIVKGTAVYTAAFTPPTAPLTAITNTSLLTCKSNRFIDTSTNAFTITKNGDVSVQRFSPFSPSASYSSSVIGGSAYFDGTGDYLLTPATGQFAPTGDFTVSFWYYPLVLVNYGTPIGNYTTNASTDWLFESWADGTLKFYAAGGSPSVASAAGALKLNQWHYISMSRSGTTITGYLNGVSQGTAALSGTFGTASKAIAIGALPGGSSPITGYISDVKLIDGSAVTTVPTGPQTATTGTKLLLNFTGAGIIDNAMMTDLETGNDVKISTAQSKFGGSSMYFDGTGDYLLTPVNSAFTFGTGDFTIEMWIYTLNVTNTVFLLDSRQAAATSGPYACLMIPAGGTLQWYVNGAARIGPIGSVPINTWAHVAVCRSSGVTKMYLNGTAIGSPYTDINNYSYITQTIFGGNSYAFTSNNFPGYIDDLRVTTGYARYTANFTPPTAALPTS